MCDLDYSLTFHELNSRKEYRKGKDFQMSFLLLYTFFFLLYTKMYNHKGFMFYMSGQDMTKKQNDIQKFKQQRTTMLLMKQDWFKEQPRA